MFLSCFLLSYQHRTIFLTSVYQDQLLFPFTGKFPLLAPHPFSASGIPQYFYSSIFLLFIFGFSSCIYYFILFPPHIGDEVIFWCFSSTFCWHKQKLDWTLYRVQQGIICVNRVLLNSYIPEMFHLSVNLELLSRQSIALMN